ncbi:winged helix DNA-binding domain-containing protein [Cytophagaceae bacterium YF14B1]|uniref:Winged helix DNA-binding domain-containing protein n=1 Tax=Xanthocytophaga flava TaxID=3048013 RepID=A0AAE3U9J3_9BACT|nr:winged helix DNA-binding domain-containing protein [Xanthocytophaga flavus]MDJ1483737.1 winged helix DNA-binding domain-containing protein [Xanthocytophaga flavus]
MTSTHLIHTRLHNQQLLTSSFTKPEEVVQWLGAVQAQDYAGAKWAIAQRCPAITDKAIDTALTDGRIIRTHIMRPTWHFVTPEDIQWILAITSHKVKALNAPYCSKYGLEQPFMERCLNHLQETLTGNQQKTRPELLLSLQEAGLSVTQEGISHIMIQAEQEGIVCSGGLKGKHHTYKLLTECAPFVNPLSKEEALAKLSLRYFTSHGPATLKDYIWWSGLSVTDARKGLALIQSNLVQETIDNQTYWFTESASPINDESSKVYLLPNYDEYIVGYANREVLTDKQTQIPRGNILFSNTLIVNGQITGTWKRTLRKSSVQVDITLFRSLKENEEQSLHEVGRQYASFLELPEGYTLNISR